METEGGEVKDEPRFIAGVDKCITNEIGNAGLEGEGGR